jgi:hypothetical protein
MAFVARLPPHLFTSSHPLIYAHFTTQVHPRCMPKPNHARSRENPLKSEHDSKARTRALADRARPTSRALPTADSITGQGGSDIKGARRNPPDVHHPTQYGGVKPLDPQADPRHEPEQLRPGLKRKGPSPADEPRSPRTGTAPRKPGDESSRSGRTKGFRSDSSGNR